MTNLTYAIGKLAELTETTVRALRIYESYGLIAPARGPNGHRIFAPTDLRRVRQIVALKRIGLTLAQIEAVLSSKAGVERLVNDQLASLEKQWRDLAISIANLHAVKGSLDAGALVDLDRLCDAIERAARDAPIVATYYCNEQLKRLIDREPQAQQQRILSAAWKRLFQTVERLAAEEAPPSSAEARAAAQLWSDLLHEFTRGDQDIAESLQRQAEDSYADLHDRPAPPGALSKRGWQFISQARGAAQL